MSADDTNDDLKSFQIGLMSGASKQQKKAAVTNYEISSEDYPNLSNLSRSKSSFKRKTTEKLETLKKDISNAASSEEKEQAEKAKKAWERALEVLGQVNVKS